MKVGYVGTRSVVKSEGTYLGGEWFKDQDVRERHKGGEGGVFVARTLGVYSGFATTQSNNRVRNSARWFNSVPYDTAALLKQLCSVSKLLSFSFLKDCVRRIAVDGDSFDRLRPRVRMAATYMCNRFPCGTAGRKRLLLLETR